MDRSLVTGGDAARAVPACVQCHGPALTGMEPAIPGLPYMRAELVYAAREEMAQTLDDVLARRTRAVIQRAQPTMAAAHAAATLIAPDMGWDEQTASNQAAQFIETCQKELLTAGLDLP